MTTHDQFFSRAAERMQQSAIRKMGSVMASGRDIISFAPGYPAPDTFAWRDFQAIAAELFGSQDGSVLQYGPTRGYRPLLDVILGIQQRRGITAAVEEYRQKFHGFAAPIILVQGLTPIPFKLVAIASGLAHVNFFVFVLCATITRSARFFVVAGLIRRYGAPMQAFIEKRMALVGWFLLAILAAIGVALWLLG